MPSATAYPAATESCAWLSASAGSLLPAVASDRFDEYEVDSSEPRMAMPIAPPSSCEVSLTALPTPSSSSGNAPMIASVQGESARPIARPSAMRGATKSPYDDDLSTWVSSASAIVPPAMPATIVAFMPMRGVR